MTNQNEDPLHIILRSKRESTRFQILVEIAEHQPSIRQQEIANKLGVTPQAVSEYIRELSEDGMVFSPARGRYNVTHRGVEWVLGNAEALEAYSHHITHNIIQQVSVWTAIADFAVKKGERLGVYMKNGWLYAGHSKNDAEGVAISDASQGKDVGITDLTGIIAHSEGHVRVCKVPRVQNGGSRAVSSAALREAVGNAGIVGAIGLEAYVALESAGRVPDMYFGAREGIIEAAFHGLECAIVIVEDEFTDFLKRLETTHLPYEIIDLASS